MRNYFIVSMFIISLFFTRTEECKAQVVVTDPGSMGAIISDKVQSGAQHLEILARWVEQLRNSTDNLDIVRSTWNAVTPFLQAAPIVYELYDNFEYMKADYERLERLISRVDRLGEDISDDWVNLLSGYEYEYILYLANKIITDAIAEVEHISKALDATNSMTLKERLNEVELANKEIRSGRYLIDVCIEKIQKRKQDAEFNAKRNEIIQTAFGSGLNYGLLDEIDLSDIPELADARSTEDRRNELKGGAKAGTDIIGSVDENASLEDVSRNFKQGGAAAINVASIILGILAALFTAWNFGMVNSADRQHGDALFKVYAGFIVGLLLLQLCKTLFF